MLALALALVLHRVERMAAYVAMSIARSCSRNT